MEMLAKCGSIPHVSPKKVRYVKEFMGKVETVAEPEKQLNLVAKLAKIRSMCDVVQKDQSGYNYKYADINSILASVTAGMKKYGVSLFPSVVPGTFTYETVVNRKTKYTKSGDHYEEVSTEMLVSAQMIFRWVNDDNLEETIEVPWHVIGSQADPSQAFGSGLTYCTRYFFVDFFQIAQPEEDVDSYRSKQKEAEASEEKALADGIIDEFDTVLKTYLSDHQDNVEEIKEFIAKYVKKSNYRAIKEPRLASKLLTDFKEKYLADGTKPESEDGEEEKTVNTKKKKKAEE